MFLFQDIASNATDSIPTPQQEWEMLKDLPVDELINKLVTGAVSLCAHVLLSVLVFYVGRFIIKKVYRIVAGILLRRQVDASLSTFILSLIKMLMYFILVVTIVGILGIETSSFIAIFASAGVAMGMALSGTLQNFAGGVLILLLKPYKIGDYIEAQGYAGTVREIQIFHTIISTPDNKQIIIPNGGLSTGSVNNFSRADYRRVDWSVSISYGDNIDNARKALMTILETDDRLVKSTIEDDRVARQLTEQVDTDNRELTILERAAGADAEVPEQATKKSLLHRLFSHHKKVKDNIQAWQEAQAQKIESITPKTDGSPKVFVEQLADSAVMLKVRAWTLNSYYWDVYFSINERIYNELPAAGIHFPFPQMDVHLKTPTSNN